VRKTTEDAFWRNKKVFLNGAAVKNRIPGCFLSRDKSRKHGNVYIGDVKGDGNHDNTSFMKAIGSVTWISVMWLFHFKTLSSVVKKNHI